jgi:integrase
MAAEEQYEVREGLATDPPYQVHAADGSAVAAVSEYLQELVATDCSRATIKAYAYALLDWFRFLSTAGTVWREARSEHVRDYVLQLRSADNPYRHRQRTDAPAAGMLNPRTGKPSLAPGYAPATINHRLSVIASYYEYHRLRDSGIRLNPVLGPAVPERPNAHRTPDDPWIHTRRVPYRQKQPAGLPRAITDELWQEVFACLTSNRDRAIFCLLLSSGSRAGELLAMTDQDVDWGRQSVRLVTKGTRVAVWVAASPDTFRWLRLYLIERGELPGGELLWWTLRMPRQPLTYQALRKILTRINEQLGTNLVLHDFRHTCALQLASDPAVSLIHVQAHLGHKHITTTERYLHARPEDVVRTVRAHYDPDRRRAEEPTTGADSAVWHYDDDDLRILLGSEEGERS